MALSETWRVVGLVVGAALIVAWNLFFVLGKDARRKRAVWRVGVPVITITTGLLMIASVGASPALAILLPALWLVAHLCVKHTRFCDGCGATLFNVNLLRTMRVCPRCDASLDT